MASISQTKGVYTYAELYSFFKGFVFFYFMFFLRLCLCSMFVRTARLTVNSQFCISLPSAVQLYTSIPVYSLTWQSFLFCEPGCQ